MALPLTSSGRRLPAALALSNIVLLRRCALRSLAASSMLLAPTHRASRDQESVRASVSTDSLRHASTSAKRDEGKQNEAASSTDARESSSDSSRDHSATTEAASKQSGTSARRKRTKERVKRRKEPRAKRGERRAKREAKKVEKTAKAVKEGAAAKAKEAADDATAPRTLPKKKGKAKAKAKKKTAAKESNAKEIEVEKLNPVEEPPTTLTQRLLSRYRRLVSGSSSSATDPPASLQTEGGAAALASRRQLPPHLPSSRRARLSKKEVEKKDGEPAAEEDESSLPDPEPELAAAKSSKKVKPDRTFTFSAGSIAFEPVRLSPDSQPPVPTLAHGLDRTLFNPGVHWLQDPRTRVFNFDPSIQDLVTPSEFNYDALPEYRTSSRDEKLVALMEKEGKKYSGSTSSMTKMLSQIYLMLNGKRPLNLSSLTQSFPMPKAVDYSPGAKMPASIILKYNDGRYSIDADKSVDDDVDDPDANILSSLGHVMEKLFTVSNEEFARFLKDSVSVVDKPEENSYAFGQTSLVLTRSQLDCYNPHLPGNGTFDIKTRAVVAVRQDRLNHANAAGYQIRYQNGAYESFEREWYDLVRSAFLKYQFQARIGQMDGCFVAYHNTQRIFGFEYVPITRMDEALFGSPEEGDKVFKLCLGYMEQILEDVTAAYPDQSVAVSFWNNRKGKLLVFAQPTSVPVTLQKAAEEYKVFEYKNHNYLDGDLVPDNIVDVRRWVIDQLGADDASERAGLDWSVFCQLVKREKSDETDELYMRMRNIQTSITQLTLPEGVSRRALRTANWPETTEEAPLDGEEEIVVDDGPGETRGMFVPKPGKKYREKATGLVKELRSLAKDGWAHQAEADKLAGDTVVRLAPTRITIEARPVSRRSRSAPSSDQD